MIEMLRHLLHIGRNPPRLGDIGAFDMDADRQAARYEAMQRRRPPAVAAHGRRIPSARVGSVSAESSDKEPIVFCADLCHR